jgi:hypothetical protein
MSKSNDISATVARQVSDESWMFFDDPTCINAKIIQNLSDGLERSVAIVECNIYPVM